MFFSVFSSGSEKGLQRRERRGDVEVGRGLSIDRARELWGSFGDEGELKELGFFLWWDSGKSRGGFS